MKAIIIGAGIAGLTTAIALEQAGIKCEVYESAPSIKEVGAGILMAPNAMQVFRKLGFADQVADAGCVLGGGAVTTETGKVISHMDLARLTGDGPAKGVRTVAIHRGRLQGILLGQFSGGAVHTGKRLKEFAETPGGVKAVFEDGSEAEGDILLGADGIHSAVRAQLFPTSKTRYSGQTCWRGIADFDPGKQAQMMSREMWGGALRFGYAPISSGEIYWFAVALAEEGGTDEPSGLSRRLQARYAGFSGPVAKILAHTRDETIIRGDICDLRPMPSWHQGRVLLLGDAGHATTPNLGQGGCQAVEDAWTLSRVLGGGKNWEKAFVEFEAQRRKKVDGIVKNSWRMGKMAHWRRGKWLRNFMLRMTPDSVMARSVQRIYRIGE